MEPVFGEKDDRGSGEQNVLFKTTSPKKIAWVLKYVWIKNNLTMYDCENWHQ